MHAFVINEREGWESCCFNSNGAGWWLFCRKEILPSVICCYGKFKYFVCELFSSRNRTFGHVVWRKVLKFCYCLVHVWGASCIFVGLTSLCKHEGWLIYMCIYFCRLAFQNKHLNGIIFRICFYKCLLIFYKNY